MSVTALPIQDSSCTKSDRIVVITGAGRGIGAACAHAFAANGVGQVVLLARTESELETVAGQVEALGSSARIHSVDVTKVDDIERVFQCIERIDVLVNCAGLNVPQPFLEVNPITFDRIWEVNVRATYFVAQAAAQRMVTNGKHGVIVNITSQMGHVGAALRSAYCTSKHAVEGMTKALAVELAPHGIRVVSIAPTFVRTSMTEQQLDDPNIGTKLLADIPIGRFGNPTEIAAAVVFAASKDAGLFTGSSLLLDGGWTAK